MYKILIVDEEETIYQRVRIIIPWDKLKICQVRTASNGVEALSIIPDYLPDIILTDIETIDKTEYDFIIKSAQLYPYPRLIVLTSYANYRYVYETLKLYVHDFLLKPIDKNVLLASIKEQLCFIDNPDSKNIFFAKNLKQKTEFFREIYDYLVNSMIENTEDYNYLIHTYDIFCGALVSYNIPVNCIPAYCFEIASKLYYRHITSGLCPSKPSLESLAHNLSFCPAETALCLTRQFLTKLLNREDAGHLLISKAQNYISQNLSTPISVSQVAEALFVSPNYFSRLFKRVTGEGCSEYIIRKKMEQACALLTTTTFKTSEIANMVGYHDSNYFSVTFKKYCGISPKNYRNKELKK